MDHSHRLDFKKTFDRFKYLLLEVSFHEYDTWKFGEMECGDNLERVVGFEVAAIFKHETGNRFFFFTSRTSNSPDLERWYNCSIDYFGIIKFWRVEFILFNTVKAIHGGFIVNLPLVLILQVFHDVFPLIPLAHQLIDLLLTLTVKNFLILFIELWVFVRSFFGLLLEKLILLSLLLFLILFPGMLLSFF